MSIGNRVGNYWRRRLQQVFVNTMKGVFASNVAGPNDMSHDISGGAFVDGVTNFNASAFIDTTLTMGDSMESLGMILVHSVVYGRMQKNNLIDFIPDAEGNVNIPTFLGREVIIDDGMPFTGGVFESWMFGPGAVRMGVGAAKVPVETFRYPASNNGGGSEALFNRVEWCLHPAGFAYIGTAPSGGPSNAATTNNLGAATSWNRVWTERKQVKIARLVTREF
jgi:hypothetical protein